MYIAPYLGVIIKALYYVDVELPCKQAVKHLLVRPVGFALGATAAKDAAEPSTLVLAVQFKPRPQDT